MKPIQRDLIALLQNPHANASKILACYRSEMILNLKKHHFDSQSWVLFYFLLKVSDLTRQIDGAGLAEAFGRESGRPGNLEGWGFHQPEQRESLVTRVTRKLKGLNQFDAICLYLVIALARYASLRPLDVLYISWWHPVTLLREVDRRDSELVPQALEPAQMQKSLPKTPTYLVPKNIINPAPPNSASVSVETGPISMRDWLLTQHRI